MEHTKGKLEANCDSYHETISIDSAEDVVCVFWHLDEETHNRFEYENAKANAERLCLCWNSHDALLAACELTEKRLLTHGEWDDNCFYYAGHSASELEEPLRKLKAAIAAGEK